MLNSRRAAVLGLVFISWAACVVIPTSTPEPEVSGAFGALNHWGASRAYPRRAIPAAGYTAAHEHVKASVEPMAAGAGWAPIGPNNGGGRTLTIAFHPLDSSIVYAGSASGGLWRSTTGGVGADAWDRIDTGHPILGVSTIAFAPDDPNVMFIGTGEVYNYQAAGDLEADRATRGSYGAGILKSVDGGATWTKSLDWSYNQQHGVWAVRFDPIDSSVVWAATTEGVFRSADAGATWDHVLDVVMAMDMVVHPTDTDTVLVGCGNLSSAGRGIYRTVDGGESWTQVSGGGVPLDFAGKIQFGVTPADADVVYASIGNGFTSNQGFTWLLRSDDFGATFALQSTVDYSRWQGWFAHDVAVHPTDPDTIICIGIDVWKSVDAGATLEQKTSWTAFFTGDIPDGGPEGFPNYSHADHHDVIFDPSDGDVFYLANDGGVFRSTDLGETYAGVNGGYQTTQFYNGSYSSPTDPNLAMGGLQDNASVIYRGNGLWARWVNGGDGGWCAVHPEDPDIMYATSQFLNVRRSSNGGESFSSIAPPGGGAVAFIAPFVMSPTNPDVLYGARSFLYKTTNEGDTWSNANGGNSFDGNPVLVIAIAKLNDDVIYLATAPQDGPGGVYRSLDEGDTFTDITGTLPDRYPGDLAVHPTDEATAYIAMSGFGSSHVFKTTDYGANWTDIDGGALPDVPTTAIVVDPELPDHVYVGNDVGVFFTDDDGATWTQLATGLPQAVLVNELGVSLSNRRLRAFTHGLGVWEHDLVGTPCTADVDGDGTVGTSDVLAIIAAWNDPGGDADVNEDGVVNVSDLLIVLEQWGPC